MTRRQLRSPIYSERLSAPRAGSWAAVLAIVLAVSCQRSHVQDDAGDASTDAGIDASFDAGVDAQAPRDSGVDAGPTESEWLPLEGLPAGCEILMAADPASVVDPLRFEPCPDLPGCRQLVVDWPRDEGPRIAVGDGLHDGEHGYFSFGRGIGYERIELVVGRDDGLVLAALRAPTPTAGDSFECFANSSALASTRMALSVATTSASGIGPAAVGLLEWGAGPPSFRVLATLTQAELGLNNFVQQMEIGDGFVAAQVAPRQDILRIGFDGSVRWVNGAESGSPSLKAAVDDALFYDEYRYDALWVATGSDETARALVDPPDADAVGINADQVALVWAEMSEQVDFHEYERVELWTASFTTDPAELVPRLVARLPVTIVSNSLYAAHGHAFVGESPELMYVYSLESGLLGSLRPPPGTEWRGTPVTYIGPEEFAVAPYVPGLFHDSLTLRIHRYDSLPAE